MSRPKFIDIDGKRIPWRELMLKRREQIAAVASTGQPTLFELKEDRRPMAERSAADRYREPSLFSVQKREG